MIAARYKRNIVSTKYLLPPKPDAAKKVVPDKRYY